LWRFDLENTSATYLTAVKVAVLKNALGTAQPITTKPELGLINSRRVIFVGTGRFLGVTDKADTSKQSIYAIADDLAGNVTVTDRTPLVQQTITAIDSTSRTVSSVNVVDWTNPSVRGWFIDLPDKGERVSVDPQLQLGTLVVGSNVPSTDTCVAGGTAWINSFDFRTGGYVAGATGNAVSQKITGSVAANAAWFVVQFPQSSSGSASVIGVVVAEISTGLAGGVGRLIIEYAREATDDPAKVYTAVFAAALLGLVMTGLVVLFDLVLMRNRPRDLGLQVMGATGNSAA